MIKSSKWIFRLSNILVRLSNDSTTSTVKNAIIL